METQEVLPPVTDPKAQVRALDRVMAAVVEEFGADYVYQRSMRPERSHLPGCWYVNTTGDGPDCLVGQVLHRFGWTLQDLDRIEGVGVEVDLTPAGMTDLSRQARVYLGQAQGTQDSGEPWGTALVEARQLMLREYGIELP